MEPSLVNSSPGGDPEEVYHYNITIFDRRADGGLEVDTILSEPFIEDVPDDTGVGVQEPYQPPTMIFPACVAFSRDAQYIFVYLPERAVSLPDLISFGPR